MGHRSWMLRASERWTFPTARQVRRAGQHLERRIRSDSRHEGVKSFVGAPPLARVKALRPADPRAVRPATRPRLSAGAAQHVAPSRPDARKARPRAGKRRPGPPISSTYAEPRTIARGGQAIRHAEKKTPAPPISWKYAEPQKAAQASQAKRCAARTMPALPISVRAAPGRCVETVWAMLRAARMMPGPPISAKHAEPLMAARDDQANRHAAKKTATPPISARSARGRCVGTVSALRGVWNFDLRLAFRVRHGWMAS
jgi:hypothetical protein